MISIEKINEQRTKVFEIDTKVTLFAPCKIGEGILSTKDVEFIGEKESFLKSIDELTFFTPASGSGSRMFQFLFDFLEQPESLNSGEMERFMNSLKDFAFFHLLPISLKDKIKNETIDPEELARFLLGEDGLHFGKLPKGLIPFHFNEPVVLNPFQDHLVQGTKIANGKAKFHFTIQPEFEEEISASIRNLEGMTGTKYDVSYSFQCKDSNSVAFDERQNTLNINDKIVTRPSGHGALLKNLNEISSDFIFIKNIDNVQHYSVAETSFDYWLFLGNILKEFKSELATIYAHPSKEALLALNQKYQFLSPTEVNAAQSMEDIKTLVNRPTRVCGMVKNEGQPGGGPFWIEQNGKITKQIIEKSQISQKGEQFGLMLKSTHFNPVMIAASTFSLEGKKFDLTKYVDESQYFVVIKSHQGKVIRYMEQPGLWNGGMAYWNTIFVEAPKDTFSPVKTVLDLLGEMHRKV